MCSRLLTMSRSPWQKRAVEFATRQKLAQETEVSQELNGQIGSFCCQDQAVCNFFAHLLCFLKQRFTELKQIIRKKMSISLTSRYIWEIEAGKCYIFCHSEFLRSLIFSMSITA